MSTFFKKTHIRLKPEITSGVCPHCEDISSFVSIVNDNYRCMNCGFDVEQKINGVIKYLPLGQDKIIEHGPKRPRGYGYVHVKQTKRKRPGRHSKKANKKHKKKKSRGQG